MWMLLGQSCKVSSLLYVRHSVDRLGSAELSLDAFDTSLLLVGSLGSDIVLCCVLLLLLRMMMLRGDVV